MVGVNGVGKTTTIGKLSAKFRELDKKVLLAAGDTFRAAAIEQLEIWAGKTQCDVIVQQPGSDPSAVAFDAVAAAKARGAEILIVDTAGRLHTKSNLMEELKKIKRVMAKALPGSPHEILLVLDATTGQNALSQARMFHEALGVTGIVMTKLDGTAKGGVLVALATELKIPVRYIGVGEDLHDLLEFNPEAFVEGLLD
jgi:fused signal recognition particle receptor